MNHIEWTSLIRIVKNKGEYHIFKYAVDYFLHEYPYERILQTFIVVNTKRQIFEWYKDYYYKKHKDD